MVQMNFKIQSKRDMRKLLGGIEKLWILFVVVVTSGGCTSVKTHFLLTQCQGQSVESA